MRESSLSALLLCFPSIVEQGIEFGCEILFPSFPIFSESRFSGVGGHKGHGTIGEEGSGHLVSRSEASLAPLCLLLVVSVDGKLDCGSDSIRLHPGSL